MRGGLLSLFPSAEGVSTHSAVTGKSPRLQGAWLRCGTSITLIDARLCSIGVGVVMERFLISPVSSTMVDHLDPSIIKLRLPKRRGTPWEAIPFVSIDLLHCELKLP